MLFIARYTLDIHIFRVYKLFPILKIFNRSFQYFSHDRQSRIRSDPHTYSYSALISEVVIQPFGRPASTIDGLFGTSCLARNGFLPNWKSYVRTYGQSDRLIRKYGRPVRERSNFRSFILHRDDRRGNSFDFRHWTLKKKRSHCTMYPLCEFLYCTTIK